MEHRQDLSPTAFWDEAAQPVPISGGAERNTADPPPLSSNGDRFGQARFKPAAASPVTAADVSSDRMLRPRAERPSSGWRLFVFRVTGGRMSPRPSRGELRRRELVAIAKTPIQGCRKIAFISRKGGVGKTTTCLLAGHAFASHRGDRVIALDGNPDAGTLAHRLRRETTATLTSMLRDVHALDRYADIRAYTSQTPTRLEVVAADDDPHITQALGEDELRRAIHFLERHYNLVCLDTGTGVLHSATRGILNAADQVVVVAGPSVDGARAASSTLDWLEENGYPELARTAVAVVNGVRGGRSRVDLQRIDEHFASRCRAVVHIPWDAHLEAGGEANVDELAAPTRDACLELAAAIAVGFTDRSTKKEES